jgi:hypothetical protein
MPSGLVRIEVEGKHNLVIASLVFPGRPSETNPLLLVDSIRDFAGALSEVPIWCYAPVADREISATARKRFLDLDVNLIPFEMNPDIAKFPFMRHAHSASLAEAKAETEAECLGWLAPNTIVLREPKHYSLDNGIDLGYRPVHHKLLGMTYDEPLDSFWADVYRLCNVSEDQVFEMRTQVEDLAIRPYFNAGSLIVRPERKILRTWYDTFLNVYQEKIFREYYRKNECYAIFIHQAILSGIILSTLKTDEMAEFPSNYNYPQNLYAEDISGNRPDTLEQCVTIRHEGFHQDKDWMSKIPAQDELKNWIAARLL